MANGDKKETKETSEENGKKAEKAFKESLEKSRFQEILAYIEKTDLEYVYFEKSDVKISMRRSGVAPSEQKYSISQTDAQKEEIAAPTTSSIRSPIVGRFHRSMGSDRPPLVVEGGNVTVGQKVAIVEAMKIKKEVFSAVAGKVIKISLKDGDPVEYGQELFIVEPDVLEANR